jgi:hypothetical protein
MLSKVVAWLDEQGFTLEMRTAEAFRAAGFAVRQSSQYVDAESGKSREIDVLAIDRDHLWGAIEIAFVIECKSSKTPWVLLCSSDTLVNYNRLQAFAVLSEKALGALVKRIVGLVDRWPWFRKDGPGAYSVRQAFSHSDAPYTAAVSVAKASTSWVRAVVQEGKVPYVFAFPVVVTDAPLIRCDLDPASGIRAVDVQEGEWLFFAKLPDQFATCVRVLTLDHLPHFVSEARQYVANIREELKNEEEQHLLSMGIDRSKLRVDDDSGA